MIEYVINYQNKTKEIPVGIYEFDVLNKEIDRQLKENGDQDAFDLVTNLNTFKSKLKFTHNRSIKKV